MSASDYVVTFRDLFEDWLENLKGDARSASATFNDTPIKELLFGLDIHPASDDFFKKKAASSETLDLLGRGLDLILVDTRYRGSTVKHLALDLRGNQALWLEAVCSRLSPPALSSMLTAKPVVNKKGQQASWPSLASQVLPNVPVGFHEEIVSVARARRNLPELYAATGWELCRQRAQGKVLDALMSIDLGL